MLSESLLANRTAKSRAKKFIISYGLLTGGECMMKFNLVIVALGLAMLALLTVVPVMSMPQNISIGPYDIRFDLGQINYSIDQTNFYAGRGVPTSY
jgi:hypothetical protein